MIGQMSDVVREPKIAPVDRRTAWKIVLSVVVVVGAVSGLLWASLKEEIQLWKSPDEVAQSAPGAFRGKRLNVGGHVLSLTADHNALVYNFEIESLPPRPHAVVKARYHGLVPDTFKTGGEVVATGKIGDDGTLVAESVMAKCPSKYDMKQMAASGKQMPHGMGPGAAAPAPQTY
jgi:cytochrome c-type biogenesis protein CcmE